MISHLLYADDLLIFVNCGKAPIWKLMDMIRIYENMSGDQLVSPHKSSLFFSTNISIERKRELKNISGFEEGAWSCTYLGIPLHVG